MKLLVKGSAIATVSLFLCSGFAQAADVAQNTASISVQSKVNTIQPVPDIARILPSDTPYMIMVSTKSELWGGLNRFQLFKMIGDWASQYKPKGFDQFNFDYQRDIESKLTDQIGLVFLPKTKSTATIESNFLMVAGIKDPQASEFLLNKLQVNSQGAKVETYKGVKIYKLDTYQTPLPSKTTLSLQKTTAKPHSLKKAQGIAIAALPGYIIAGQSPQPIEQLVDSIESRTNNLANNSKFQQTFQNPQAKNALATLYMNPTTFFPLIQQLAKDPSLPFPVIGADINLKDYNKLGTVNGFMNLQPEGVHFQVNVNQSQFKFISNNQGTILSRMPAATYTTFTGSNLNAKWQILAAGLSTKPEFKKSLGEFRNYVRSMSGLDFDRDIMSWMDGEYGLFLFPTKGGLFSMFSPNSNMGVGLAIETSNHDAAEAALQKLSKFIKSTFNGQLAINTKTVKGQTVTSWDAQGDASKSVFAYSWLDNKTLVVSTGLGAIADLVPKPNVPLTSAYNFTTATNSLPHPNDGYFYVNMGSLMSWVYGLFPLQSQDRNFAIYKQAIGSVYSVSATTATKPDQQEFDILLVLAPDRKKYSLLH